MSTPRIQSDTGTAPTNYPQARHPLPKPQITISTPTSEASSPITLRTLLDHVRMEHDHMAAALKYVRDGLKIKYPEKIFTQDDAMRLD